MTHHLWKKYIPEFHFELKFHQMYLVQNFHLATEKNFNIRNNL